MDTQQVDFSNPNSERISSNSTVEWLAEQEYPKSNKKGYPLYMPTTVDLIMSRTAFIKGYQAAEKELYTEDDLRKAIEMADYVDINGCSYTEEEIIEQIKQSKK